MANGIFTTTLDFGAAAFPSANRFLEIAVRPGASTSSFTTLAPLQPITATPYALMSLNAATANAANSLSAACTLCVTDAQIAAVSGSKISGPVANATNAVNATNATTAVNFSGALAGDVTGTQSATALANNAVTTAKLADGSVTNPKLANGSVTDAKIVDVAGGKITGSITTATIPGANVTGAVANATSAVNFSGSLAGEVTGTQGATVIANNAVTTAKLADGSVTDAKIVSVSGGKITGSIFTATIPGANVTGTVANALNATNASNATNATNATTAINFTGALAGDVTGNQGTTTVEKLRNLPLPAPVQADNGKVLRYKNDVVNPASFELATVTSAGGTITGVTAGTGLSGGGTSGTVNIGIAANGVGATELANNAVTAAKIAAGQVVKSINGLTDNVTLAAGNNITITPVGNTLTIAAIGSNAILNQTTLQTGANFNISGDGRAGGTLSGNVVNASTQFNLNDNRLLSTPGNNNLYIGLNAGTLTAHPDSTDNTFVGFQAGKNTNNDGGNIRDSPQTSSCRLRRTIIRNHFASTCFTFATTFPAVNPNFSINTCTGALAPKRSSPMTTPLEPT